MCVCVGECVCVLVRVSVFMCVIVYVRVCTWCGAVRVYDCVVVPGSVCQQPPERQAPSVYACVCVCVCVIVCLQMSVKFPA